MDTHITAELDCLPIIPRFTCSTNISAQRCVIVMANGGPLLECLLHSSQDSSPLIRIQYQPSHTPCSWEVWGVSVDCSVLLRYCEKGNCVSIWINLWLVCRNLTSCYLSLAANTQVSIVADRCWIYDIWLPINDGPRLIELYRQPLRDQCNMLA